MGASINPEGSLKLASAKKADWFSFHFKQLTLFYNIEAAAGFLKAGGILVYPTETYYAIGCSGNNEQAARTIMALKKRNYAKPMPLLAGSLEQAALATNLAASPENLLNKFWPGPLTIILPAKQAVANPCKDSTNCSAIRVSSATSARALASLCDFPISSSSANFAGACPAASLSQLDAQFLKICDNARCGLALWLEPRINAQILPSTIVKPESARLLHIIREGMISKIRLQAENFEVI